MQKRLATQGMLNAAALADFRWEIAVGDERMTLAELRARINQEGELLTSGSALFHLTKEDLDRLVAEWAEAQKKELSNWDKLRALLSGSSNGRRVEAAEALLERIRESAAVKELPPQWNSMRFFAPIRSAASRGSFRMPCLGSGPFWLTTWA